MIMSSNIGKKMAGATTENATSEMDPDRALAKLLNQSTSLQQNERNSLLKMLGDGIDRKNNPNIQASITKFHQSIGQRFMNAKSVKVSDSTVLQELLTISKDPKLTTNSKLRFLLAKGTYGRTILHTLLDPGSYETEDTIPLEAITVFDFGRLKPLITSLIHLQPKLPVLLDIYRRTPLFAVLNLTQNNSDHTLEPKTKEEILRYLCEDPPEGLGSSEAIESLTYEAKMSDDAEETCHAIHRAIENDVKISESVLKAISGMNTTGRAKVPGTMVERPCLDTPDSADRSCLHIALTAPFTDCKISWAKILVTLKDTLLQSTCKFGSETNAMSVTPLQHFAEQRQRTKQQVMGKSKEQNSLVTRDADLERKLDDLEAWLKHQCLRAFDSSTCRKIMYRATDVRETFLAFENDDEISGEFLAGKSKHYKLDSALKYVYIPKVAIRLGGDKVALPIQEIMKRWDPSPGRTELFLIFQWLRSFGINKVVEVIVHDFGDEGRKSHSDRSIIECLKGLQVETWDWRRMDIPSSVITEAAGEHVKTLYLYCSGLGAVLQSWSNTSGLPTLKSLGTVYLQLYQGLESIKTMTEYRDRFQKELEMNFFALNKRKLIVHCEEVKSMKTALEKESTASKVKGSDDEGFEEQAWLKCMDEFADTVQILDNKSGVKVALIDDGVKSSYAGLDDNIDCGWVWPAKSNSTRDSRYYSQNYDTSYVGHGTVMAYYIRRVCPKVRLYIAKLSPQKLDATGHSKISFTIESTAEAIKWAVEQGVDIICMSWAIDKKPSEKEDTRVKPLRDAITQASRANILLFCANPDKGAGHPDNKTYPKLFNSDIVSTFCIGAATKDGNPWGGISPEDKSCDYLFPGVELGIPVEGSMAGDFGSNGPPSQWRGYSGSSLSCALAVGLAALILHCAQIPQNPAVVSAKTADSSSPSGKNWMWLRSPVGMRQAFDRVNVTQNRWLPVKLVFGESLLTSGTISGRKTAIGKLVNNLLKDKPHDTGTVRR